MATQPFAPPASQSFHLMGGDAGTAQTIARIRSLVSAGKKDIDINRLAISIVWPTPQFTQTEKAQAIFNWVQQNTRFISMITGAQTLRTAKEILRVRAGDCANLNAVLIPSLLGTIGIDSRLVTVAGDSQDPGEFTHVYAEANADGRWIPMDVARPGAQFGLAPEQVYRKRMWDLRSSAFQDVPGLSGYLTAHAPRRRGGMGDAGDIVNSILSAVPAITTGTTNIIRAVNAPSSITYPISSVPAGYTLNSAGQLVPSATLTATATGISSNTLLLIGAGVLLILMMNR